MPGRVGGLPIQVLVDTGCTTNLLSKRIFDQLPRNIQAGREEYVAHGSMANGARLAFSGLLRTDLRVRQYHGEETFVVGEIDADAILGMPFLAKHECQLNFQRNTLTLQGQELTCTDRQGRVLLSKLQACQPTEVPPRARSDHGRPSNGPAIRTSRGCRGVA